MEEKKNIEEKVVLIDYKETGMLVIGKQKPFNQGETVQCYTAVKLQPGINEIKLDDWDSIKNNPIVEKKVKDLEIIRVIKVLPAKENYLASISPEKAKITIDATAQLDLLMKWEKMVDNKELLKLIDSRIVEINTKPLGVLGNKQ